MVRRRLFRTFLSLPAPILRLLAGGAQVGRDGRTLDPRLQYLGAARGATRLHDLASGELDPRASAERHVIDGPAGPLALTLYRPSAQDRDLPALVFAPFAGSPSDVGTCSVLCSMIAAAARCPLVCVDYRRGQEDPALAGLADVRAAYAWTRANAERFGAPADDAAIGGVAEGAAIAAKITHDLRRSGEPQPALQLLLSPRFAELPTAASLAGVAPAIVATTGFDPLSPAAEIYARRLGEAGVSCLFRRYDSLSEAFIVVTGLVPAAEEACREIAALTANALQSRYAPPDAPGLLAIGPERPAAVDTTLAFH